MTTWTPALDRPTAMRLAVTEYDRCSAQLRSLRPSDWATQTECPAWDVRQLAAHMLGMVEMAASIRESTRQQRTARRRGGVFIDALTDLQVQERADWSPERIVDRFGARCAKAAAGRRRAPGFMRKRTLPQPQQVNGTDEQWSLGFLLDVILTRDPWMHRVDIARATGAELHLTHEHDGVLVADVVSEWLRRHGQPVALTLTGPAGGSWSVGETDTGRPTLELDAIDFCRTLSNRTAGTNLEALLGAGVPF